MSTFAEATYNLSPVFSLSLMNEYFDQAKLTACACGLCCSFGNQNSHKISAVGEVYPIVKTKISLP